MHSFANENALTSRLRIRVCGSLEVQIGGRRVEGDALSRWHIRALLALLAGSAAMSMDREAVCDALWPDSDAATARNRLYHTVMLLRRALSHEASEQDWVHVSGGRVRLHPDVVSDALLMRQLAAAADPQASSRWLMQQEGPVQPFAPWLPDLPAVGALRSEMRAAWQEIIGHAVGQTAGHDDTPARRRLFEHLLRLSPANEAIHCALMRLDLRAGRAHRVVRQFDLCARMLAEQLGLKPSPQAIDLARQADALLATAGEAERRAAPVRARDLSLVGRGELTEVIAAALRDPSAPIVTLAGIGGVGKSRIARELAGLLASEFANGAVWIDVRNRSDAAGTAGGILRTLIDRAADAASQARRDTKAARSFSGLVVLDEADCCSDLTSVLAAVVAALPTARWLVTAIRPTGLPGERCFTIPPLAVPPEHATPTQVLASPAVQLLLRRAFPVGQLDAHHLAEIGELVRRLDGLPLAIELAATRLPLRTAAEICTELEHDLRPLDSGPVDFESHQQSMSMTLDQTVAGLSADLLALYQVVAVPAGDFDLQLLARLSPDLAAAPDTVPRVDALEKIGVITRISGAAEPARWRMGHLPRLHAAQMARRNGLDLELKDRHLAWVAQVLSGCTAHSDRVSMCTVNLFDALHPEIGAALRHAESVRSALLPLVVSRVGGYWNLRGHFGSGERWLDTACTEALKVPAPLRYRLLARLRIQQSSMRLLQSHVVDALSSSSSALEAARATGDAALLAEAANLSVRVLIQSGRLGDAIGQAAAWIDQFGQSGDHLLRGLRRSLGVACARSGKLQSTGLSQSGLHGQADDESLDESSTAVETTWAIMDSWDDLYRLGLWSAALDHAHRARRLTGVAKATYLGVGVQTLVARSARAVDWLPEALQAAEVAIDQARQSGLSTLAAQAALVAADVLIRTGELDGAERMLSISIDAAMDPSSGVALYAGWHAASGLLAIARGRLSDASDHLLAIASETWLFEDMRTLATAVELGIAVCASTGQVQRASRLYQGLTCLDRPGLAPRVPLEVRWLRQHLRDLDVDPVQSDASADHVALELIQELGALALLLTQIRRDG